MLNLNTEKDFTRMQHWTETLSQCKIEMKRFHAIPWHSKATEQDHDVKIKTPPDNEI